MSFMTGQGKAESSLESQLILEYRLQGYLSAAGLFDSGIYLTQLHFHDILSYDKTYSYPLAFCLSTPLLLSDPSFRSCILAETPNLGPRRHVE
jgi:hypothetical protein